MDQRFSTFSFIEATLTQEDKCSKFRCFKCICEILSEYGTTARELQQSLSNQCVHYQPPDNVLVFVRAYRR